MLLRNSLAAPNQVFENSNLYLTSAIGSCHPEVFGLGYYKGQSSIGG